MAYTRMTNANRLDAVSLRCDRLNLQSETTKNESCEVALVTLLTHSAEQRMTDVGVCV